MTNTPNIKKKLQAKGLWILSKGATEALEENQLLIHLSPICSLFEKIHDATNATLRNQQASIHNTKQQIGKLSRLFNEHLSGTLPTQKTERYEFVQVVDPVVRWEWTHKLRWLRMKGIALPPVLRWERINDMRIGKQLILIYRQFYGRRGLGYMYRWRKLFRIQEPAYQEVSVEFFSIVRFKNVDGVHDPANFTFYLVGEGCNVAQLT